MVSIILNNACVAAIISRQHRIKDTPCFNIQSHAVKGPQSVFVVLSSKTTVGGEGNETCTVVNTYEQ